MTHKICPRCTSWTVQVVNTRLLHLLHILNLRFFYCEDCGWWGIARPPKEPDRVMALLRPAVWKRIFFGFLVLAGIYATSDLWLGVIEKCVLRNERIASQETMKDLDSTQQDLKVIGNRKSKRYHLPGMKYYDRIDTQHRIEFSSEDEAIKAGYHKAPR